MISFRTGNLLAAEVEAMVNAVNTVGIMGKGIALTFKEHFPENFKIYQATCRSRRFSVGKMLVTETKLGSPKWIVNFPTKEHWRHPSKMEWIEAGLDDLKRVIVEKRITSVALPALGSGNGGLRWPYVRERIIGALGGLDGVEVLVFEPNNRKWEPPGGGDAP